MALRLPLRRVHRPTGSTPAHRPGRQEALDEFVAEIEEWRTQVGNDLERLLPGTYAARVFLSARGAFPGADVFAGAGLMVGATMTPGFYQYTHVRECRDALNAILARRGLVRSAVGRSQVRAGRLNALLC